MRFPSYASSAAVHIAIVVAVFSLRVAEEIVTPPRLLSRTPLRASLSPPAPLAGGGGERSPLPASKGRAPRRAEFVLLPPTVHVPTLDPALPIEPAVLAISAPSAWMPSLGDPNGLPGPPSSGQGRKGGIGTGSGGGAGPGSGPLAGGAYSISAVSTAPVLLHKVEPEYSEQARQAKFNGSVLLRIVVDELGRPRDIQVVRPAGLGLEETAVDAVRQWRFRPARKGTQPVAVLATVEVNFRLL